MDFEIPKKYGLRQTIGDTIGIGGIFRGLRTIPVMVRSATSCTSWPGRLLLNYTNPMAMVPWAVYEGIPFANVVRRVPLRAGHPRLPGQDRWRARAGHRFRTAGFNHQCFVLRFRDRGTGEDLYPRLREVVDADPEGLGRRVRVEIFRRFGYFPTESSEHSSEYVPWFLRHDDQVERFRCESTSTSAAARRTSRTGSGRRRARRRRGARDRAHLRARCGVHLLARDRHRP